MTHYLNNNFLLVFSVLFLLACTNNDAREFREFQNVDASVGLAAGAGVADRKIRLEQLEAIPVITPRIAEFKNTCLFAYQAFDNAAKLLLETRQKTAAAEAEVKKAELKKNTGEIISALEEARIVELGNSAVSSLKSASEQLDNADHLVKQCEELRIRLRRTLSTQ